MTGSSRLPRRGRWQRLWVITVVLGSLAVGLRVLDAIPPWLLGEPRAPRVYETIHHFERDQQTRLLVPFVFPDWLVWPPAEVVLGPGTGRPVLLRFERSDGQGTGLLLAQTLDGDHPIPARLLPPLLDAVPLDTSPPDVPMIRGRDPRGLWALEARRVVEGRRVVLRVHHDDPVPLARMVRSLRRH